MVDRLLRLVLTLLVSTATTERCFSAMKLAKAHLRCTMGDGFSARLFGTPYIPNYKTFDFFDPKFDHSSYSKNLCKYSQI